MIYVNHMYVNNIKMNVKYFPLFVCHYVKNVSECYTDLPD